MARISMRNVQKSPVSEYFDLFLSSAAARGVKDKTLSTYKQRFHSISKPLEYYGSFYAGRRAVRKFSQQLHSHIEGFLLLVQ